MIPAPPLSLARLDAMGEIGLADPKGLVRQFRVDGVIPVSGAAVSFFNNRVANRCDRLRDRGMQKRPVSITAGHRSGFPKRERPPVWAGRLACG